MEAQLDERPPWLLRIRGANRAVVGAGFLVGPRHALTCAHVVNEALGRAPTESSVPDDDVSADFPFLPGEVVARPARASWFPIREDEGGDIALLELETDPPRGAGPPPVRFSRAVWGHSFRTYGFPTAHDRGVWAHGKLLGWSGDWVQLEGTQTTGRPVEQGFSGAPVWDEALGAVVGMVVVQDLDRQAKTSFMIPASGLAEASAEIRELLQEPSARRGRLVNVPRLPAHFVNRPAELAAAERLLLGDGVTTERQPLVGLAGMGGTGKSVLAAALCQDEQIRLAFSDGVLWLRLDPQADVLARQAQLAEMLGDTARGFVDAQQGRARLSKLLEDRACLVVLDDVWHTEHVEAFDALGQQGALLLTTRNAQLVVDAGGTVCPVGVLRDSEPYCCSPRRHART